MNSNPYILLDERKFLRKISNIHPFSFYGFSITILSCTHILPMPQLQAKADDVTKLVMRRVFSTNL